MLYSFSLLLSGYVIKEKLYMSNVHRLNQCELGRCLTIYIKHQQVSYRTPGGY